ncbi:hypothetical protein Fmac_021980 [Flemingia macrophylla]|uniref:Uncharacterized protein n=1 Tax=Flemingia macrophylla TaxID=520843 RepID=A0ABD1LYG5_9FABA
MALVMKQLNQSDKAIEAMQSFHHLCPSESQESLDNILVELYKHDDECDLNALKNKQFALWLGVKGKGLERVTYVGNQEKHSS